jgi:ubiquinone/menaquinone biosynthesis C-methylase UbiE
MINNGNGLNWTNANGGGTNLIDLLALEYHKQQWKHPKESTKAFSKFFRNELLNSRSVIDLGTGAGAATYYLATEYSKINFIGMDHSDKLLEIAKMMSKKFKLRNLSFETGDWFNLDKKSNGIDGVISLQTLSWLSEIEKPMTQIFEVIKPNWIGISSLFYEGDISCQIEVFEHSRNRKSFYNVYSLKELSRLAVLYGYEVVNFERFDIGIDIPKPKNIDLMGTFTEKVEGSLDYQRIQISGPLLMNWYFVLLKKSVDLTIH